MNKPFRTLGDAQMSRMDTLMQNPSICIMRLHKAERLLQSMLAGYSCIQETHDIRSDEFISETQYAIKEAREFLDEVMNPKQQETKDNGK